MKFLRLLPSLFLLLMLSACSFSLTEDVTPPPGSEQSASGAQSTAAARPYPAVPPDPSSGAPIYAEQCARCHGEGGLGDGTDVSGLAAPVPAIGLPKIARLSKPAEWFSIITLGNAERQMPSFSSLTDAQRWDVLAYVYSLSETKEIITLGQGLYTTNCTGCHGSSGKGDGPDAAGFSKAPQDLTDQAWAAGESATDIFNIIKDGVSPHMPAFGSQLKEAEIWALSAYLHQLTFASPVTATAAGAYPAPAEGQASVLTPYPLPAQTAIPTLITSGTVRVEVVNGSGGDAPADVAVTLYGFDSMQNTYSQTLTVGVSGIYTFTNVELPPGRVFWVWADYAGSSYESDVSSFEPGKDILDLQVVVYETSTDSYQLTTDRAHLLFDFTDPNMVQVIEVFIISNPTDRAVTAKEAGGGVITFMLPEGATNLQFQDGALGERYLEVPGGFVDTASVPPGMGQYQEVFGFQLPYKNKLDFSQTLTMNTNTTILLVPESGVKIKGGSFTDGGVRDMQGVSYHLYNGDSLTAGQALAFNLSGRPKTSTSVLPSPGSAQSLAIGLGFFGLALVVAGLWLYRRNRRPAAAEGAVGVAIQPEAALPIDDLPDDQDALMDAILALDDLYQAGKLPEEAYLQRRTALKEQLRKVMDK